MPSCRKEDGVSSLLFPTMTDAAQHIAVRLFRNRLWFYATPSVARVRLSIATTVCANLRLFRRFAAR
jgi:hypothetical protein